MLFIAFSVVARAAGKNSAWSSQSQLTKLPREDCHIAVHKSELCILLCFCSILFDGLVTLLALKDSMTISLVKQSHDKIIIRLPFHSLRQMLEIEVIHFDWNCTFELGNNSLITLYPKHLYLRMNR